MKNKPEDLETNPKNKLFIVLIVFFSILLIYGLTYTGQIIKEKKPREITIFAVEWEFVPSEIKVKYNEDIRLRLVTSEKNESFGFKLSRYMYNYNITIEPNTTKYFDFKAYNKGIFIYRCENPCGWGKNLMIGKLIVE